MKKPVPKRGGARTGAGRPRVENPVVKFTVSLPFEVVQSVGLERIKKELKRVSGYISGLADKKPHFVVGNYDNIAGEKMSIYFDVNEQRLYLTVNGFKKASAYYWTDFARQCSGVLSRNEPDARQWVASVLFNTRNVRLFSIGDVNYHTPEL